MSELIEKMTIVEGQSMSLVFSSLQKERIFVPNALIKQIPKSLKIPVFRHYGSGKFTPVWVGETLLELSEAWEKMPMFTVGSENHKFKGEEYPIATKMEIVEVKPATAIKKYRVNELFAKYPIWTLPFITNERLKKVKEETNTLSLLDTFYCYDSKAVLSFDKVYNEIVKELTDDLVNWKKQQDFKIGDSVMGLKIEDITKNPNETATYEFEDGSTLHENYIWEYIDENVPPNVEKVRFSHSQVEYLINGKWCDDPEEEEIDF